MNNQLKPHSIADYLAALFIIVAFFAGFVYFWRAAIVSKSPTTLPECSRSFEAYQTLVNGGQSVELLRSANMYAANGKFVKDRSVTVIRSGEGEIACGYLYVRAKKDGKPLEEKYESIFIDPQELGGHLLIRRGMPIPMPIASTTEALLPLEAIPYLTTVPFNPDSQDYRVANWAKLLNVSNQTTFLLALSIEDPRAVLEEVRIAYKCWNPNTGLEVQTCQLSVK